MNRQRTALFLLILLTAIRCDCKGQGTAVSQDWIVTSASVAGVPVEGKGATLTGRAQNAQRNRWVTLKARSPIERVTASVAFGEDVAVLGKAGRADIVVRLSIRTGRIGDQFFCYGPHAVSGHWIAAVEFYFSSLAETSNDVVFIYDLSKSAAQNRAARGASAVGDMRAVSVGTPVFPEANASAQDLNYYLSEGEAREGVIGSPFVLLGGHYLVFSAAHVREVGRLTNEIISVDISDLGHPVVVRLPIPRLGTTIKNDAGYIRIDSLVAASKTSVLLKINPAEYGVDQIEVSVLK